MRVTAGLAALVAAVAVTSPARAGGEAALVEGTWSGRFQALATYGFSVEGGHITTILSADGPLGLDVVNRRVTGAWSIEGIVITRVVVTPAVLPGPSVMPIRANGVVGGAASAAAAGGSVTASGP
ncbi:MAG: hypothetical protein FJW86_05950 [Actinobacteria bacterium]|nr:hypothetical protein [Actinomycetota bacterium]